VPAAATVRQGLQALIKARSHLAFVVTESGQYAGLFTLEDGWRAALGESRLQVTPLGEDRWRCDGELSLGGLPFELELELDPPPRTLGGLVAALTGQLPAAGQRAEHGGYRFTIETVSGRRAGRVGIEKLPNGEE